MVKFEDCLETYHKYRKIAKSRNHPIRILRAKAIYNLIMKEGLKIKSVYLRTEDILFKLEDCYNYDAFSVGVDELRYYADLKVYPSYVAFSDYYFSKKRLIKFIIEGLTKKEENTNVNG